MPLVAEFNCKQDFCSAALLSKLLKVWFILSNNYMRGLIHDTLRWDKKCTYIHSSVEFIYFSGKVFYMRATRGARNPNLNIAVTNACAAVV